MTYRVAIYDVENGDRGYMVHVPLNKRSGANDVTLNRSGYPYTVSLYTGAAMYPIAHFPDKRSAIDSVLYVIAILEVRFPDRLGYDFRLEPIV